MRNRRRGNVLVLVAILAFIAMLALFSVGFMSKTDIASTGHFLRELLATHLCESVAAQIEAQVNSSPWFQRFWLVEAQAKFGPAAKPKWSFDKTLPYIDLSGDSLPTDEYTLTGVVKDLPGELRQYRIYLECTLRGETYAFSWDKRWEQTLMTGLNRESTELDKPIDAGAVGGRTDELIDSIKETVAKAPEPEGNNPTQEQRLDDLRDDEKSFDVTATVPDPTKVPTIPSSAEED
jgi:hypothetical protein